MHVGPPHHVTFRRAGKEAEEPTNVDRETVRRVWAFARPYRRRLLWFLGSITVGALLSLAPPLLFKRIVDDGILNHDRGLVTALALAAVVLALLSTVLDLVQRWLSAAIGEGLIFDLRTALY